MLRFLSCVAGTMSPRDFVDLNPVFRNSFWEHYVQIWRDMGFVVPDDEQEEEQLVEEILDEWDANRNPSDFEILDEEEEEEVVMVYPGRGTSDDPIDLTCDEEL